MASQSGTRRVGEKRKSRALSLTRAERADVVRRRLFEAAIEVVGELGYSEASVSRITQRAGVAQGTFYNHFPNRQDLLDQLLPTVGQQLLDHIRDSLRRVDEQVDRERTRFSAFFDFLRKMPQFMRILTEAQLFAPKGYAKHLEMVAKNYQRGLRLDGIDESQFSDRELEVAVHILMGARSYLSSSFSHLGQTGPWPEEEVFTAYEKLMRYGLFGKPSEQAVSAPAVEAKPVRARQRRLA